jgi:hypothetical protein
VDSEFKQAIATLLADQRADREAERKERGELMAKLSSNAPPPREEFSLTPSDAASESTSVSYQKMMSALNLSDPVNGEEVIEEPADKADINFVWPRNDTGAPPLDTTLKEKLAYEPTVEYLKTEWGLNAYDVGKGNNCDGGELFKTQVHTLRQKFDLKNPVKEYVEYVGRIHGNSDVIVTTEPLNHHHYPHHVRFMIEIKTVAAMSSIAKGTRYSREAITQVCGLTIHNDYRSVPVILTNMKNVFAVYYIRCLAFDPLTYTLFLQLCPNFKTAVNFSLQESELRRHEMVHLGRPPTPLDTIHEEIPEERGAHLVRGGDISEGEAQEVASDVELGEGDASESFEGDVEGGAVDEVGDFVEEIEGVSPPPSEGAVGDGERGDVEVIVGGVSVMNVGSQL